MFGLNDITIVGSGLLKSPAVVVFPDSVMFLRVLYLSYMVRYYSSLGSCMLACVITN